MLIKGAYYIIYGIPLVAPSAEFRWRQALGYSTYETPPNLPPSQLEEDGRVF